MIGAAFAVVAAAALASAPASAASATVVAGPYAAATGFATPQIVVYEGDAVSLVNTDIAGHRIEATEQDSSGNALFSSPIAGITQSVPVVGVESLAPGDYGFVCALHTTMTGTITVLPR